MTTKQPAKPRASKVLLAYPKDLNQYNHYQITYHKDGIAIARTFGGGEENAVTTRFSTTSVERYRHEFNKNSGDHRLVITEDGQEYSSPWVSYSGIAICNTPTATYAATSEYFVGVLPPVFEITLVDPTEHPAHS